MSDDIGGRMSKNITVFIDTDGKTLMKRINSSVEEYQEIVKLVKKKKDLEFNDTYIPYKHVAKVWYEEEE